MSEAERLADELDDTPNWQKEKWGSQWKHGTMTYSRVPFEAAAELRRLSAELAALKAATFTVLEGFTLPHDVRKILESALYTIPKDKP